MKVLIVADEVWNDQVFGNNVLTNWFQGFDVELAEIYCSPGVPKNACCKHYFQLTDAMMAKSILGKRAGRAFDVSIAQMQDDNKIIGLAEPQPQQFYRFMKRIAGDGIRIVRDLIWLLGRYDKRAMQRFVDDFQPDVVFCPRLLTPKLRRLEHVISKITDAPIVAFTGDDEASFKQVNWSPLYWIRRYFFHRSFVKQAKIYDYYLMHSKEQAADYHRDYHLPTGILLKCGDFSGEQYKKEVGNPIRLVYAGRLYCNRWKTLSAIGDALKVINADGVERMVLDVYTQDELTKEQKLSLSNEKYVYLKGAVKPDELKQIYREADIALHVESFDKRYKYATKVSFSTKIIDLMASSCAIMAICWERHAGYEYLKEQDAAFCIPNYEEILPILQKIVEHPQLVTAYATKAWMCGKENHQREVVQKYLKDVFQQTIDAKA